MYLNSVHVARKSLSVTSHIMDAFHLVTQVDTSIVLSLSNAKKDKTLFVPTCGHHWMESTQ